MNSDAKLIFGWLFIGVCLPMVGGGVVISLVPSRSTGPAMAMTLAGAGLMTAGIYYYRRAGREWRVSLKQMIRPVPGGPTLIQAKFLAGTAAAAGCGVVMVLLGLLLLFAGAIAD